MNRASIHIVTGGTPGLQNDAKILLQALKEEFQVDINISRERNLHLPLQRARILFSQKIRKTESLGIFTENIPSGWRGIFRKFVLIPNQEWMRQETQGSLAGCTQIWCKTRYAQLQFSKRNIETQYIGFTSIDRHRPEIEKNYREFLHIPGRSAFKGTGKILSLWMKHPEWPTLTVVTRDEKLDEINLPNINIISSYLSDLQLDVLMNRTGIHLCTSETEGFGHYLNEALSTKAVVVTTNAPPMNELIQSGFGELVAFDQSIAQDWSERFFISENRLEETLQNLMAAPLEKLKQRGELSRDNFLKKKLEFQENILKATNSLVIHE